MQRTSLAVLAVALVAGCAQPVVVESPRPQPGPQPGPPPRDNPSTNPNNPNATAHALGIPPGKLPKPGECRIWVPGMPPGHQDRSRSCRNIMASAQPGSWVIYRPTRDRNVLHVHVVDNVRPGVTVVIRFYDATSGAFLREERPDGHEDQDEDEGHGQGRGQGQGHGRDRQ